jgi:hypothetical protein
MEGIDCGCLRAGPARDSTAATYLGIDHARSRFAEVEIEECTHCRRRWLHYSLERDGVPLSGRWYRGLLDGSLPHEVTADSAVALLGGMTWYFAGGPWYGPGIRRLSGPPEVDA